MFYSKIANIFKKIDKDGKFIVQFNCTHKLVNIQRIVKIPQKIVECIKALLHKTNSYRDEAS